MYSRLLRTLTGMIKHMTLLLSLLFVSLLLISYRLLFAKIHSAIFRFCLSLLLALLSTYWVIYALERLLIDGSSSGQEIDLELWQNR